MAQNKAEESFFKKYRKEIYIGVIALITLIFIVKNSEEIEFHMVFFKFPISKIFLIAFFFILGALAMWIKQYYVLKEKNKKIKELEEQLKKQQGGSSTPPPVIPPVV